MKHIGIDFTQEELKLIYAVCMNYVARKITDYMD